MINTSIRGVGVVGTENSSLVMNTGKSGGESFGKIMSQSLASNSSVSQNSLKNEVAGSSLKSNSSDIAKDSSTVKSEDTISKDTVSKVSTDKNSETVKVSDEKLLKAAEKVKNLLKDKFGLSDEELEQIMSEMGLGMLDLLESANITDLVVNITGVDSAVAIITDSELSESLTDILEYLDNLLANLDEMTVVADNVNVLETADEQGTEAFEAVADSLEQQTTDNQSVKQDSAVDENTASLEQVIESKMTVENNTSNTANTGKRHEMAEDKNSANTESYTTAAGNLSQSIQNVFNATMTSEMQQVNATDIVRQIVDAVKLTNTQNMQSIEIQLNPESLGKINLTVSAKNGVITAEIATQNEQVKRAIESQMTTLKENLENQGIKVDAVEITVQSHAFESGQSLQGNNSQQEQAAKEAKKALKLDSLTDLLEEELSEEETTTRNLIMNENSSVEYTA